MLKTLSIAKTAVKKSALMAAGSVLSVAPALAGGLDEGTNAINEIKVWAYGFLGAGIFVFLIYKVIMALTEKETWGDVFQALGKVAMAGGVLVAGEWAWNIFGS